MHGFMVRSIPKHYGNDECGNGDQIHEYGRVRGACSPQPIEVQSNGHDVSTVYIRKGRFQCQLLKHEPKKHMILGSLY
jgi:hypothetical protein